MSNTTLDKKMNKHSKIGKKPQMIFYASMVILPIIQFVIFYLGVNFNSIFLAFKTDNGVGGYEWVGFYNFERAFAELTTEGGILLNSVKYSIIIFFLGFLTIPINLFACYYVYKQKFGSEFFKVFLYLPGVLSSVIIALLYKEFMDTLIPELLLKYFNIEVIDNFIFAKSETRMFISLFMFNFAFNLGGGILVYVSAMNRIPESILEAGKIEGITPLREFISITIPLIIPTFGAYLILQVSQLFTNQMYLYDFFGDTSKIKTVGYYIFTEVAKDNGSYPYAAAMGLMFTLVAAPLTILTKWLIGKYDAPTY